MRLLAHRGFHATLPENTLEAFSAAINIGFAGIETDVRLSANQELILVHDRVTRSGRPVSSYTRNALSEELGYKVPTLQEALATHPETFWNIEIKTTSAAAHALSVLRQYQHSHRILVTSFRHDIILEAANKLETECGFLNAHNPVAVNSLLHAALPHTNLRTLVWDFEIIDIDTIRQTNALGFKNIVYGARTREEHELLVEYGMHAVITDFPQFVGLPASEH